MKRLNFSAGRSKLKLLAFCVAAACQGTAQADDIDVFKNNLDYQSAAMRPNVLLMIDNGASWSSSLEGRGGLTKKEGISNALVTVANDPELLGKVNLGMMIFATSNVADGGKPVLNVEEFTAGRRNLLQCMVFEPWERTTTTYKAEAAPTGINRLECPLKQVLPLKNGTWDTDNQENKNNVPEGALCHSKKETTTVSCSLDDEGSNYGLEKGNNSPLAKSFREAYYYFKGGEVSSGAVDGQWSYDWETDPFSIDPGTLSADPDAFLDAGNPSEYDSPTVGSCASNFVVLIASGGFDASGNSSDGQMLSADMAAAGMTGGATAIDLPEPDQFEGNWSDEYAQFMARVDLDGEMGGTQAIITYVIDVFDPTDTANNEADKRAFYKSVAARGKGRYFAATSADEVAAALTDILKEVQAVNTSFASASMPISMTAETQGTNENQVYIGMFRPDERGRPRWMGNLKRYQYVFDATDRIPVLADADENRAYDPVTGFINATTRSFWTTPQVNGLDYWRDMADYDIATDSPDGPVVEKGATAQRLRERLVSDTNNPRKLLTCSGCSRGQDLQALNMASLASWMSGYDVANETGRGNSAEGRPSIHGDVLHSRPLVLNYNRDTAGQGGEDVVVFYGANDGLFRAIRGSDGSELWAMSFPEHELSLQTLYSNLAEVNGEPVDHPYFMDGSPTAYTVAGINDALTERYLASAWLFLPMRRGGDFIYALDVSDVNSPKFLWKVERDDGEFSDLGQTWSTPKPAYVRAHTQEDGTPLPVVFFGAGYDAEAEDYVAGEGDRPPRDAGQGIYMLDAQTGARIWYGRAASGMDFSVAGDLTLVNYARSPDNFVDRIYFADTGGNIWRLNVGSSNPNEWTFVHLADFGGSDCAADSNTDCRKFLYNPSVVIESSGAVSILIGSGDREHPLESTVQNRMYLLRDRGQQTVLTESGIQQLTSSTTADQIEADKIRYGWYFNLRPGEKVVGNALTQAGVTYFNTNTPALQSSNSCVTGLGEAREYMVEYNDPLAVVSYLATTNGEVVAGGGFPPPPVPMTLKFDNETYWSGVGGLKPAPLGAEQPGSRRKTFWSRDIDSD